MSGGGALVNNVGSNSNGVIAGTGSNSTSAYTIRPNFKNKFRPSLIKDLLKQVLTSRLTGLQYHAEQTSQWTREIADEVKAKLKELDLDRYKYTVQVVIGEQRGEGVQMATRCFWDSDTDSFIKETFVNDSFFAICVVYGVYYY